MFVKHVIRTIRKQNPATGRYNFPGIKNTNNTIHRLLFSTAYQDDYIKDININRVIDSLLNELIEKVIIENKFDFCLPFD